MARRMRVILDNWKTESFWIRTVFILVFYGLLHLALFAVFVITAVQWLSRLVSGEGVDALKQWSIGLSMYINQIIMFITFQRDDKPFPFADWPVIDDDEDSAVSS